MKSIIKTGIICVVLLLVMAGCEYDAPTTLWDADATGNAPDPAISQVTPGGSAAGGVNEIEIQGSNFSNVAGANLVYFNNVAAELIAESGQQLVVLRPNIVSDQVTIKVVVPGALQIARFSPYGVTAVVENFTEGGFDAGNLRAMGIDNAGNFYWITRDRTMHRRAAGSDVDEALAEITQRSIGRMRFGPDGNLYYIRENNPAMYKFTIETATEEAYVTFPASMSVFDYDQDGNAWVGGNGEGLLVMKSPDDISVADDYSSFNCLAIRVYDNAVYVLAQYDGDDESVPAVAVWKNGITGNGTVSAKQLFFNWSETIYGEAIPTDLEFASDGTLFIASDHEQPVVKVSGGTILPLYKGMIPSPVTMLDWGQDNYLYIYCDVQAQADKNVYRLDIGQEGAPHYGR
ncbi:IPT/TIG domain-containing protein [bacterium]|nr:IPT/TIG domain-containing protein [bacterium]